MEQLTIPQGYRSPLTIRETEVAIKEIKDHFEDQEKRGQYEDAFFLVVFSPFPPPCFPEPGAAVAAGRHGGRPYPTQEKGPRPAAMCPPAAGQGALKR